MENFSRRMILAFAGLGLAAGLAGSVQAHAQGAPPQSTAGQPYTVEYYYKCQWGHQEDFLRPFLKNHYPLLKKIGRIAQVNERAYARLF